MPDDKVDRLREALYSNYRRAFRKKSSEYLRKIINSRTPGDCAYQPAADEIAERLKRELLHDDVSYDS